jgi:hypothetical protein
MNRKEIIAVLIGTFIMMVPFLLFIPILNPDNIINYLNAVINNSSALLWATGGFVAALIAGKNIKGGILAGFLAALISSVTIFVLYSPIFGDLTSAVIFYIVFVGLFGITGGLLGGLVNRLRFKTINKDNFIINSVFALFFLVFLIFLLIPSSSNDPYGGVLTILIIVLWMAGLLMLFLKNIRGINRYSLRK